MEPGAVLFPILEWKISEPPITAQFKRIDSDGLEHYRDVQKSEWNTVIIPYEGKQNNLILPIYSLPAIVNRKLKQSKAKKDDGTLYETLVLPESVTLTALFDTIYRFYNGKFVIGDDLLRMSHMFINRGPRDQEFLLQAIEAYKVGIALNFHMFVYKDHFYGFRKMKEGYWKLLLN